MNISINSFNEEQWQRIFDSIDDMLSYIREYPKDAFADSLPKVQTNNLIDYWDEIELNIQINKCHSNMDYERRNGVITTEYYFDFVCCKAVFYPADDSFTKVVLPQEFCDYITNKIEPITIKKSRDYGYYNYR